MNKLFKKTRRFLFDKRKKSILVCFFLKAIFIIGIMLAVMIIKYYNKADEEIKHVDQYLQQMQVNVSNLITKDRNRISQFINTISNYFNSVNKLMDIYTLRIVKQDYAINKRLKNDIFDRYLSVKIIKIEKQRMLMKIVIYRFDCPDQIPDFAELSLTPEPLCKWMLNIIHNNIYWIAIILILEFILLHFLFNLWNQFKHISKSDKNSKTIKRFIRTVFKNKDFFKQFIAESKSPFLKKIILALPKKKFDFIEEIYSDKKIENMQREFISSLSKNGFLNQHVEYTPDQLFKKEDKKKFRFIPVACFPLDNKEKIGFIFILILKGTAGSALSAYQAFLKKIEHILSLRKNSSLEDLLRFTYPFFKTEDSVIGFNIDLRIPRILYYYLANRKYCRSVKVLSGDSKIPVSPRTIKDQFLNMKQIEDHSYLTICWKNKGCMKILS